MRNRIQNKSSRGHLFGLGLDNEDGHKRITQAEQFSIFGGSKETHERLTMTFMKTFERLQQKGIRLDQIGPQELHDIIQKSSEEV